MKKTTTERNNTLKRSIKSFKRATNEREVERWLKIEQENLSADWSDGLQDYNMSFEYRRDSLKPKCNHNKCPLKDLIIAVPLSGKSN